MRYDVGATVLWSVAGTAAVIVAVSSAVSGEWFAAMGWAVGAAGSAGAAIQSAALVRLRRTTLDTLAEMVTVVLQDMGDDEDGTLGP